MSKKVRPTLISHWKSSVEEHTHTIYKGTCTTKVHMQHLKNLEEIYIYTTITVISVFPIGHQISSEFEEIS